MNGQKTFEEYQEEYRRAIAQRDQEDEELLQKLLEEANEYKAAQNAQREQMNEKAIAEGKRRQVELYEQLSSTSDLKTWERILNMCDIDTPPQNVDLSKFVSVMKKMDDRLLERPEPIPIKHNTNEEEEEEEEEVAEKEEKKDDDDPFAFMAEAPKTASPLDDLFTFEAGPKQQAEQVAEEPKEPKEEEEQKEEEEKKLEEEAKEEEETHEEVLAEHAPEEQQFREENKTQSSFDGFDDMF